MQTLLTALHFHAEQRPECTAFLVRKDASWTDFTYGRLAAEVDDWAASLVRHAIAPGSVIFIVLKHGADLYTTFLGAMRAGLVPSFLPYPTPKQDPNLYWDGHKALFQRVQPSCVLTYAENLDRMGDALSGLDCLLLDVATANDMAKFATAPSLPTLQAIETPGAIALLQHSSGTTGLKKGVALSFEQIRIQLTAYANAIDASSADCVVSWLPLYHDMGLLTSFLLPVTLGCKVVSIDAFDWLGKPDSLLTLIGEHRGTLSWLPNFAFNHLARTRGRNKSYDLTSMRAFINCSEPCKAETFERFRQAFGPDGLRESALQNCYAMAEAVFAVSQTPLNATPDTILLDQSEMSRHGMVVAVAADHPTAARFMSCGRTIEGADVRIKSEAGQDVGEIQISGDFIFGHYHRNPEDTEKAFEDGWYRTGDLGFIAAGELYVCGRIKELMIVHGRNYYANDVEMVVNDIQGIKAGRAVAFAIYDPVTASEEAILLAEIEPGFEGDIAEIGKTVRTVVFDHLELSLKKVQILAPGTLVKTTSGKISRKENMARYQQGFSSVTEMA